MKKTEYKPYTETDQLIERPPQTNSSRYLNRVVYAAFIVIILIMGIFAYWSSRSTEIIHLNKSPLPTRTIREHPTADGVIILTADYCKLVDVKGTLRMSYVSNSREIFLPIGKEVLPTGCKKVEFPVLIPRDIVPDTYRIKFHAVYNLNPIKKNIVEDFYSKPVTIVSSNDPSSNVILPQQ